MELPFTCFGHPQFLDEEIVQLLKKGGCEMVWMGVQTGDENIRKTILNRTDTNKQIIDSCKLIKKYGIKLMLDRLFGIPTETEENIKDSYNFYKQLQPDVVNCYELLFFPKADINRFGSSKAKYQLQGGEQYRKYAKIYTAIPIMGN